MSKFQIKALMPVSNLHPTSLRPCFFGTSNDVTHVLFSIPSFADRSTHLKLSWVRRRNMMPGIKLVFNFKIMDLIQHQCIWGWSEKGEPYSLPVQQSESIITGLIFCPLVSRYIVSKNSRGKHVHPAGSNPEVLSSLRSTYPSLSHARIL